MPSFLTNEIKNVPDSNTELLVPGRAQYFAMRSLEDNRVDNIVVVGCTVSDALTCIFNFAAPLDIEGETDDEREDRLSDSCDQDSLVATLEHGQKFTMKFTNELAKKVLGRITVRHFSCMSQDTNHPA